MPVMRVDAEVTTLWISPDKPRPVDAPALADPPDIAAWLRALDSHPHDGADGQGRLGLHGRVHTQLLAGEPVEVVSTDPDAEWVQVRCPWQPSSLDSKGYPGWLRRNHLIPDDPTAIRERQPSDRSWSLTAKEREQPVLALARRRRGLAYLWGGTSPWGLDCSGLVHYVWRELGTVVPRDANDQFLACKPLAVEEVSPGDLLFFSHPGHGIHHVGIVTQPGRLIHTSGEGGPGVVDEPLDRQRQATLSHAGRLPLAPER